ncbi:retron St85 family effector protein [Methylocystis iwaonis]|uniref:Uncharacterized protein n=1 Tax=Methylocystis iwaonis TaxID=2885079 RepID=A0ABM8ECE4_9HYPH|nr:retron St85 family effector protein [Methylocystis iwaonis]BDV35679.1 hypothetical protein SS37A_32080 [Methylocystis iwaonis]
MPFIEDFDVDRIHVREPFEVILLCGGEYGDINEPVPKSLRDAFLKATPPKSIANRELIQAESITKEYDFFESYPDILIFETDLAQIVDLIILFCESEGSLAELGAFAVMEETLKRLFVVIREKHWKNASFVRLGPLKRIENEVDRSAIQVIADADVGLEERSAAKVDKHKLIELLDGPLERRLSVDRESTTFDPARAGHVIKLIVGLVQEYGALTLAEISLLLEKFEAPRDEKQIKGYLRCAMVVGWLTVISKGSDDYYVQTLSSLAKGVDAATLPMKDGSKETSKPRRRAFIREYWKEKDKIRFAAIQQSARSLASV